MLVGGQFGDWTALTRHRITFSHKSGLGRMKQFATISVETQQCNDSSLKPVQSTDVKSVETREMASLVLLYSRFRPPLQWSYIVGCATLFRTVKSRTQWQTIQRIIRKRVKCEKCRNSKRRMFAVVSVITRTMRENNETRLRPAGQSCHHPPPRAAAVRSSYRCHNTTHNDEDLNAIFLGSNRSNEIL